VHSKLLIIAVAILLLPLSHAIAHQPVDIASETLAASETLPREKSTFSLPILMLIKEIIRKILSIPQSWLSALLSTLFSPLKNIISTISYIVPLTLNVLRKAASGELEYRDIHWIIELIRIFAQEIGLAQTYDAFVSTFRTLLQGELSMEGIRAFGAAFPAFIKEAPGFLRSFLSFLKQTSLEMIFAPIVGGVIGAGIGGAVGLVILIGTIVFFAIAGFICPFALFFAGIFVIVLLTIGIITYSITFLPVLVLVGIIVLLIIGGALLLDITLFVAGFYYPLIFILLIFLVIVELFLAPIICIMAILAVFILPLIIALIVSGTIAFIPALLISLIFDIILGIAVAIFVGIPMGLVFGSAAFVGITIFFILLSTFGYPIIRWASMIQGI